MNDCTCPKATTIRELEIRLIGVDGTNGIQGRVARLEQDMSHNIEALSQKLDSIAEARNERLRALELRVYLICGIPAIVAATVASLKFLNLS